MKRVPWWFSILFIEYMACLLIFALVAMYLYNNQIVPTPNVAWGNRAFKYGDAFFETMLYHNGQIPLLELHMQRAFKTFEWLKMETPQGFGSAEFGSMLLSFLQNEGHTTAKVRISFWREGEGTYLPIANTASYIVEATPINTKPFVLNDKGLVLDIYRDTYKNTDFLANLKTTGCTIYTLASLWAKEQAVDDAILLNHHGRVAECTSSNIFIIKGDDVITPPLTEGCLDGVMRRHLLNTLPQKGFTVKEQPIEIADLDTADEVFTTNALGIRWVEQLVNKPYTNVKVSVINKGLL